MRQLIGNAELLKNLSKVRMAFLLITVTPDKRSSKLLALDGAAQLDDLRVPPSNRLEVLRGDRKGQHSIRVNDQWRVCFSWREVEAWNVEIVDYH